MHTFPRPTELHLSVEREPVDGTCPECGAEDLKRYPVLSEGGWWTAVKCQSCLASISREPWNLLGSITLLSDQV
jgi:vanillate/4-hydroxybenzoate decarboxylase subunit D